MDTVKKKNIELGEENTELKSIVSKLETQVSYQDSEIEELNQSHISLV